MALATRRYAAKARKLPQRSCVSCGLTTDKRELVRVVRTPAGVIEVDPTGKKAGRGAYLCRSEKCWQQALKKNRLSSSLHAAISEEDKRSLLQYALAQAEVWPSQSIGIGPKRSYDYK
jgi:predicted RNA-binding protein YlxR (DUF448 family)